MLWDATSGLVNAHIFPVYSLIISFNIDGQIRPLSTAYGSEI